MVNGTRSGSRRARGSLSRAAILDATARLVESHGVTSFSLRKLAADLGADPTAVYRHFASKDAILGALLDRALADLPEPDRSTPDAGMESLVVELGRRLTAYPGLVAVLVDGPHTAAVAGVVESILDALSDAGIDDDRAVDTVRSAVSLLIGWAVQQPSMGEEAFWTGLLSVSDPHRHPSIRRTAQRWQDDPLEDLRAGLQLILRA
ncbi:MAG: TetR/AcrR family transcriptional regulator [Dermatophilaceae bacterium]